MSPFRIDQAKQLDHVVPQPCVSTLLPVAAAWQPSDSTEAQATSIASNAETSAQKGQRQTAQHGAEKAAAAVPEVFFSTGKKLKHFYLKDLVMSFVVDCFVFFLFMYLYIKQNNTNNLEKIQY